MKARRQVTRRVAGSNAPLNVRAWLTAASYRLDHHVPCMNIDVLGHSVDDLGHSIDESRGVAT